MLARAGLGDDARLLHTRGEQRLAEHVVDLVGAGVTEILALEPDPCAAAVSGPGRSDSPRVAIAPDSVLHVERFGHFSSVNDVLLFAFDGFPFTRVPDLGETAVVVPEQPAPAEMSMVLSVFGRLAQVTGRIGSRATILGANSATAQLQDKDLLVIGGRDNPLVSRWESQLPIVVDGEHPHVQRRMDGSFFVDLLGGPAPLADLRLAPLDTLVLELGSVRVRAGRSRPAWR